MRRYVLVFLLVLTFAAMALAINWDLKAPTGLEFSVIKGYEDWHVVATHYRTDKKELRLIIGNDVAVKAYREGIPLNGKRFPDGSIIVKIGYSLKKSPDFPPSLEPDRIQRVEFMIKDSKRFKDMGDWGYARFVYNHKKGAYEVWGKSREDYKQCYNCHRLVEKKDYVFTDYVRRY